MKTATIPGRLFLLAVLTLASRVEPGGAAASESPSVAPPPKSFFSLVRERDRDAARQFYRKHVDIRGMAVVASADVADLALQRTHEIVTHMLAGRPDVLDAMVRNRMYLIVIGKDQVYTNMPEYRNSPNPDYLNERVRGTGGRPTSFGEENLLSLPLDRYDDESIAVHEFCHTIDSTLASIDATWRERKGRAYANARRQGLFRDTYAGSNASEYWAEIAQAYFDCNRVNNWNHGPIGTREQLKAYDPEGYDLARTAFNLPPERDWRYRFLQSLPMVTSPPSRIHADPYYTKFTWAREFTVLGRQASDTALLKANDTIRKMFAYRHDILKALIADGVRLVVLGRNEKIADLPEYVRLKQIPGVDVLTRALEYTSETKLLVVGEENVLANPRDTAVGDNQVIRLLATAIYHVTGTRPIDPNWENHGREVQQYELRVRRLDMRFGQRLHELHEKARGAGKWLGTAAAHDHVSYWAQGVLAYFDAAGQHAAPSDSERPIVNRELLHDYDPDLFAIVHETMAYGGKVDWRYQPAPGRLVLR